MIHANIPIRPGGHRGGINYDGFPKSLRFYIEHGVTSASGICFFPTAGATSLATYLAQQHQPTLPAINIADSQGEATVLLNPQEVHYSVEIRDARSHGRGAIVDYYDPIRMTLSRPSQVQNDCYRVRMASTDPQGLSPRCISGFSNTIVVHWR